MADPLVLVAGHDARELRIEAEPPLGPPEEREREADRLAAREEGPEDEPAVVLRPTIVATGTT